MDFSHVSLVINASTVLAFGLLWLGVAAFLRLKKGMSFTYLLFFTIFYVYLYKVLDYTLLQFQSLLLLKHFLPHLMLRGVDSGMNVNLVPLITLTLQDLKTSLLNILLMTPFGFGLPFITNFRMKGVVISGLLVSVVIESLQLITGLMANMTFRVADVNDLIFNTAGVAVGYILFAAFVRAYRSAVPGRAVSANPVLRYIAERPQTGGRRGTKALYAAVAAIAIAGAALYGVAAHQESGLKAGPAENVVAQGGDLCGGTGGNGQIVSIASGAFAIKKNDGSTQAIELTGQAKIHTSAGIGSLSNLKIGDKVTLVGGPNPDGSFAADDVFVCAASGRESGPASGVQ